MSCVGEKLFVYVRSQSFKAVIMIAGYNDFMFMWEGAKPLIESLDVEFPKKSRDSYRAMDTRYNEIREVPSVAQNISIGDLDMVMEAMGVREKDYTHSPLWHLCVSVNFDLGGEFK
jgi:hypothetical protein